ncbi:20S-pre-rRNA D-site endonuclease nob1 [Gurleya vavrai]
MIGVLDANIFINKKINLLKYTKIITTPSIIAELKDNYTTMYFFIHSFNIETQDPLPFFIKKVCLINEEKNLMLSNADIEFVALSLQLTENKFNTWLCKESNYEILSDDNGVKQALKMLGVGMEIKEKVWKFRCYGCFKIFEKQIDFCSACGYNTITRVSIREENGVEKVNFKKGFVSRDKILKDKNGNEIKSEDQKEYAFFRKDKIRSQKKTQAAIKKAYL